MGLTEAQQNQAATDFSNYWRHKGDEKSDSQRFWIDFIQDILGIENATQKIEFEKRVNVDGQTKFIDAYIPETRTLIEQKSVDKDLTKQYQQSGGWMATPYQQARRYSQFLPVDEAARWIVVCNFRTFEIHDMNKPQDDPVVIELDEIRHKLPLFDFMFVREVKELSHEMEISVKAGEIVGVLYDKLLEQYKDPDEESLKSLNALCVRLVFCLYAEDAGIFGKSRTAFHDYLRDIPVQNMRKELVEFFKILDTKEEKRDKYLAEDNPKLATFPYVNGGLFADENIEIPPFTEEIKDILIKKAGADFDWSDISPTIFGAVFESTLNPETRRSGGMHYTSIENIHKVIDPLFLDDLKAELEEIEKIDVTKTRDKKLKAYQEKLASLTFLDPACGSGNFLTETYISIRRLENRVINDIHKGQMAILDESNSPIKVSIDQFYGIEINDFAVTVAKTALWIAESQMMKETENILLMHLDFLPLKTNAYIHEGNALRVDWNDVIPASQLNYIMGNPPFIGSSIMKQGSEQKKDVQHIFYDVEKNEVQDLDYVTCWYRKAAELIQNSTIRCSFVSTNSICQGSQVPILWKVLLNQYRIHIDFAYQTFRWNSESSNQAAVHCCIIGFSVNKGKAVLFENGFKKTIVDNINPYLGSGDNVLVTASKNPICNVHTMNFGNQPRDGGNLILSSEEKEIIISEEPEIAMWIHEYVGATEFINNKKRYCIWLKEASPSEIKKSKELYKRVMDVKEFREASSAKTTRGYAKVPHLFAQLTQPDNVDYLLIPRVSSERRRYIPIGFMNGDVIASDAVQIVPEASLYDFGIITSNVHMAWMRTIAGRLKSDYRYSKEVVYNTFPWPNPTEKQRDEIERTAKAIIEARKLYKDSSLADLYDEITMPRELRKAHVENDKAVMRAYGFPIKGFTESDCVAALMKMYQELVEEKNDNHKKALER